MTKDEKMDLRRYGFAEGNYWCACAHCEAEFTGAMLSTACPSCAEALRTRVSKESDDG